MKLQSRLRWPRTLFARLTLILCVGLALTQTLSFWLTMTERDQATTNLMMGYIEREVASSVALLDHFDNALKFAGAAEITVAVRQDGQVTISVFDRGPGIPAESLETVFEPFHRLEASRNRHTGGTGLGLAIARQLTLAMDATLSLHNRPDGGLEARLTLRNL